MSEHDKVAIIGAGHIENSSAYTLMSAEIVREMVIVDAGQERAEGKGMDIAHASSFHAIGRTSWHLLFLPPGSQFTGGITYALFVRLIPEACVSLEYRGQILHASGSVPKHPLAFFRATLC